MQTQSQSSCRASGQGFELNELAKRMHDHSHIKRLEHAVLFRTGEGQFQGHYFATAFKTLTL